MTDTAVKHWFPVTRWKLTGGVVDSTVFTYGTKAEAEEAARTRCAQYDDQTFVGAFYGSYADFSAMRKAGAH